MSLSVLNQAFSDPQILARRDILEDLLDRCLASLALSEREEWLAKRAVPWLHVRHRSRKLPSQGWKLHISSTPNAAPEVLSACVPLLLRAKTSFKFALNLSILRQLNSPHASRSSSGKFITIYPSDLDSFRELAAQCHEVTAELEGPTILSDKRLKPHSSVYYRYGAFSPEVIYDINGIKTYALKDEKGCPVPDTRSVSSRQPSWTNDPFENLNAPPPLSPDRNHVLLHDRYAVTHAIRHANKGGVYLATDQRSGNPVVIKEARPHIATDHLGRDARDRLRKEAENLNSMRELGVTPSVIDMFSAGEHLFLVLEKVPGVALREFITAHRRSSVAPLNRRTLYSLCIKVTRLLRRCHRGGFIIRDFTPNNIMVSQTGRLFLIDLEMACRVGDRAPIGIGDGTPSYTSPEQLECQDPSPKDDYFSLGGILFFLAMLRDPFFPADDPVTRSNEERIQVYFSLFSKEWGLAQSIGKLIQMCRVSSQDLRYSPDDILLHLKSNRDILATRDEDSTIALSKAKDEEFAHAYRAASATVDHIVGSFDFSSKERPMPSTCLGESSHPCNVQHGAAGIGLALLAYAGVSDEPSHQGSLRELSHWIVRYIRETPGSPEGLYFGTAGAAWFLLSSSELLRDENLKEASLTLASGLPDRPSLSDITHGAAGIGLTHLHFFHQTGDAYSLAKAVQIADYLRSDFCIDTPNGLAWSRTRVDSSLIDQNEISYGFAHGIAGIGYFFLSLYLSLTRTSPETIYYANTETYLNLAVESGKTLLASSVEVDSALYWPHGPSRPTLWPHWCNGSSGVGTFLIRLAAVTGNARFELAAIKAAQAVLRERWGSGISQCHGLAGNGEYLLDLFQITGQQRFLREALYLSRLIDLHKIIRPDGITFPDDTGMPTGLDLSIGAAGVAAFFSRLAGQQTRMLMLDYLLPPSKAAGNVYSGSPEHGVTISG